MLFSNFVATIRADLDAIRDDLGEFVTTVKTDTTAMLGLSQDEANLESGNVGNAANGKHLHWEEELWEHPELLCEDPDNEDWKAFVESSPVKEEEVEMLLSGGVSEVIPELYRELVPSKTTHADFFLRLIYHRNRLNQVVRTRMQELVMDEEEETRWEDDSIGEETPTRAPQQTTPQPPVEVETKPIVDNSEELIQLRNELEQYKQEMTRLQARVVHLEQSLQVSEAQKADLEKKLAEHSELPHKKTAPLEVEKEPVIPTTETVTPESTPSPKLAPVTPPSTSWETLPSSGTSSSEEPVVVLSKTEEEEEEDDWE